MAIYQQNRPTYQDSSYPRSGVPQRIGDAERDQATECLREHMAGGRLEPEEFDGRLEKALTAHYQSDIDQLFVDLPAPHPQPATSPQPEAPAAAPRSDEAVPQYVGTAPERSPGRVGWNVVAALMWPAAIVVCMTVGWHLWWLLFIPMVMSGGCHRGHRRSLEQRHLQHRMHRMEYRLDRGTARGRD